MIYKKLSVFLFCFICLSAFCQNRISKIICAPLIKQDFQKTIDGKKVDLFFLKNGNIEAAITNYGGRIVSICVPSKSGEVVDVVLGYKCIEDYIKATVAFNGAIVGRVAGRIEGATFDLNGVTYTLPINSSPNHIHGGAKGFHNQVWDVGSITDTSLVLSYLSKNGEMGYPGNLNVTVTYILNAKNEFSLKFTAVTDKSTPVNLTNHAFFNMAGEGSGTILNHSLSIPSNLICPLNTEQIPTGNFLNVTSTPFDFRKAKLIADNLINENTDEQLKITGGFDHHFVLKKKKDNQMKLAATLIDSISGRKLEVLTDEPCLHVYSANFFKGADNGKLGKPLNYREAIALETQKFPFVRKSKVFQSIILNPGELYEAKTVYRFSLTN